MGALRLLLAAVWLGLTCPAHCAQLPRSPADPRWPGARRDFELGTEGEEPSEERGQPAQQKAEKASAAATTTRKAPSTMAPPIVANASQCSMAPAKAVLLPFNAICPPKCPYSQQVEGMSCEKVCVQGKLCGEFHPVRFFSNPSTMKCEAACGESPEQHVGGCSECSAPGVCKRCTHGLFGLTVLELSPDGRECVNTGRVWWYVFYIGVVILLAIFMAYLVEIAMRPIENSQVLDDAMKRRERARTELMPEHGPSRSWLFANMHREGGAPDFLGGRGVALYFNWLLFSLLVALLLGGCAFFAYEHSDLARHERRQAVDCAALAQAAPPKAKLLFAALEAAAPAAAPAPTPGFLDGVQNYASGAVDNVRRLSAPVVSAPPTKGVLAKYKQFHWRMLFASLGMYFGVTLLVLLFSAWQLCFVSARFDASPSVRKFAALVSDVPKDLVDGRMLAEHFRSALGRENAEELWREFGEGGTTKTDIEEVPLQERFGVVGASIAYDYHEHQEAIMGDVDSWVGDLENWRHVEGLSVAKKSFDDRDEAMQALDRLKHLGVQTETRGDILEALQPGIPQKAHKRLFDGVLMGLLGIQEETPVMLHGSGRAFVVFATQAARDAAVDLAKTGRLAPLEHRRSWHRLSMEPAHCDPCGINWENFTSWAHFWQKLVCGVLLMLVTSVVWIALYLPYAAFYADLVAIPGLEPSNTQDILLGLLIALGNYALSVVIDKVTGWAGFLYKDNRDIAILFLAFIGTLINTFFDLAMIAFLARGVMLEEAFVGKDTGYDTAAASEIFKLIVPGYLLVPYLAGPPFMYLAPFWLAKILIRSHTGIKRRHASQALRCPDFDICWRYSDILNNTTICAVLLFFTSDRAWMVMCWLAVFVVIVYATDKFLLLHAATTTVYDTHRLSCAFSRWWCLPTTLLAVLVSFWCYKASDTENIPLLVLLPVLHVVGFLVALHRIEKWCKTRVYVPMLYSEAHRLQRRAGRPWDYFNTNPVFCLRTRFLGPEDSGWSEIVENSGYEGTPPDCVPFARGSVCVLDAQRAARSREGSKVER